MQSAQPSTARWPLSSDATSSTRPVTFTALSGESRSPWRRCALASVRLVTTSSPPPCATRCPAIKPPKWPVAPAMSTFTVRASRRTPRANGRTRRRGLDRPGPGACRRQARAPSSKELAQGGPAQQLPRRDEVADHPHEGVEQRRTAGEGAREAVGEGAPRDDEPKGAGDPFLVAGGGAARLRIGAEGARGHIAVGEGAVSGLDEELGRVERGMKSLARERIIDAGGIAGEQDAAVARRGHRIGDRRR